MDEEFVTVTNLRGTISAESNGVPEEFEVEFAGEIQMRPVWKQSDIYFHEPHNAVFSSPNTLERVELIAFPSKEEGYIFVLRRKN